MAANNNSQRFRPEASCADCAKPFARYCGHQVRCADCNRGRKARNWRARKSADSKWRQEQTAKNRARLLANPEKAALYNARRRQKYVYATQRYANQLICQGCGKTEPRTSGRQIVCADCRQIKRPLSARMSEGMGII